MANGITPSPFQTGKRLIDGSTLNTNFGHPMLSSQTGITATASGVQSTAFLLTTRVNNVTTVASAADAIKLQANPLGKVIWVMNNGANSMQVFGSNTDTINAIATATGIAHPAGALVAYVGITATGWEAQLANSATFGALVATTFNGNTLATGSGAIALNSPAPILAGATLAITPAMSNSKILLNTAAGSVVTLPAATGSGNQYQFRVTTTASSNAHKILAASSSDFLIGNAVGHVAAGTTLTFSAAAATAHSIQMPFAGTQPSGGFIGDYFNFADVAANLWVVDGMYQSGTTSTTPFSSATT